MYDILIRKGLIVDGSGKTAFPGDLAIKDGKIIRIAPDISGEAKQYLDAQGLVVAPGFIDCHNHCDADALLGSSCYNALEQGVTTQITGHCGYSLAPYYDGAMPRLKSQLPAEKFSQLMEQTKTMASFMCSAKEVKIGTNMAFFVGHHNIRGKTMGFCADTPTAAQLSVMQADLMEAMEAGCLGMSTGLIYAPSAHADTQELIALAKVMAPYGGIYASHIRNEADGAVAAVEEAIRIGEAAGVQVQISHLKVMGLHNEGTSERILQLIEDANARGIRVYADQYPYTASSAALNSRIPAPYHAGGKEIFLERLRKRAVRDEISDLHLDYDSMMIASLPLTCEYENRTIGQIAREEGKHPVDVLCDILLANHGEGRGIYFNQPESDMFRILAHPYVFCGSDSSNLPEREDPETTAGRHPRGQAAMVRRLQLQRDHALCGIEEAVYRMTGGPAMAFRLHHQGLLKEDYDANITVFDYERLQAHATYQYPFRKNEGIHWVLVNGQIAVSNGQATECRAGKILKQHK